MFPLFVTFTEYTKTSSFFTAVKSTLSVFPATNFSTITSFTSFSTGVSTSSCFPFTSTTFLIGFCAFISSCFTVYSPSSIIVDSPGFIALNVYSLFSIPNISSVIVTLSIVVFPLFVTFTEYTKTSSFFTAFKFTFFVLPVTSFSTITSFFSSSTSVLASSFFSSPS